MIAFIDPSNGQVMAFYIYGTNSTIWTEQGFLAVTIPKEFEEQAPLLKTRNCRLGVDSDGQVISCEPFINPVQPTVSVAEQERAKNLALLKEELESDDPPITDARLREFLRIQNKLA
jgi:hypothetical protein